jgi:hypothetical protein
MAFAKPMMWIVGVLVLVLGANLLELPGDLLQVETPPGLRVVLHQRRDHHRRRLVVGHDAADPIGL